MAQEPRADAAEPRAKRGGVSLFPLTIIVVRSFHVAAGCEGATRSIGNLAISAWPMPSASRGVQAAVFDGNRFMMFA